ncbi:MAG: hypothetical protein QM754_00620 [Tepidisphaeraceae bacterium]
MRLFREATRVVLFALLGMLCVLLVFAIVGCVGNAESAFDGYESITTPNGVTYTRQSASYAKTTAPPAASQPAVATATPNGADATSSGVLPPLAKSLNDYVGGNFWILYVLGGGMILAACVLPAVPLVRLGKTEAVTLGIGGVCLLFTPTFLAVAGPVLAIVAALAVVFAAFVWIGRKLGFAGGVDHETKATAAIAARKMAEGEKAEAAAMLATMAPVRNAAAKGVK